MKQFHMTPLLLAACLLLCGCSEKTTTIEIDTAQSDEPQQSSALQEDTAAADPTAAPAAPDPEPSQEAPQSGEETAEASAEDPTSAALTGLPVSDRVETILNSMTTEEKIYQMFIVTPELLTGIGTATAAGETTRSCLQSQPVGGLIYFSANLETVSQAKEMLANTQFYARESGIGLFLAVDEEGGKVARVADKLGTTSVSSMATYGARNDANEIYNVAQTIGTDISCIGFNVDFAPVADVDLCSGNELGNRIFSSDPDVVANMVSGYVRGLQSTGVAATLKHFPGLGAEDGNAHYDTRIVIDRTLDQLREEEFVPFAAGIEAGSDFVMVSHQIVTGVGDDLPACLSYTVCTELLREGLGFDGLIVTDSFQMNTISGTYSASTAAVMAVEAGVDVILMPTDLTSSVQAVENAVSSGQISEERINESVARILTEKEKLGLLA